MINIKVVRKIDARDKTAPALYYGCVKTFDRLSIDQLAKRISSSCTATRSDCLAVLSALQEQVIYALQQGARVSLGDLGFLRVSCKSGGVATPEEFECSDIKKLRIVFTPSQVLRNAFKLTNPDIELNNLYKETRTTSNNEKQEEEEA